VLVECNNLGIVDLNKIILDCEEDFRVNLLFLLINKNKLNWFLKEHKN
jgi:hypothetical protein